MNRVTSNRQDPGREQDLAAPSGAQPPRLVLVTGLSGSGKSVALRAMEDIGFRCIDNLPANMVETLLRQPLVEPMAIGVDARAPDGDIGRVETLLADGVGQGISDRPATEVVFITAGDRTLVNRFSETRRRHPLTRGGQSLTAAIAAERRLLEPLAERADLQIDTSDLTVHDLRRRIWRELADAGEMLTLMLQSFGFKRGVPAEADYVFDVRCLANPHWQTKLRPQTGMDQAVADFLNADDQARQMADDITAFIERWIPCFEGSQRSYLTVCMGCTGGRHRSVWLAERIGRHFRDLRQQVLVTHRELEIP